MESYAFGARHFVMRCDPSTVAASIRKGKKLFLAHQCLVFGLFFAGFALAGSFLPFHETVGWLVLVSGIAAVKTRR